MKTIFLSLFLVSVFVGQAQTDTSLVNRLNAVLKYTKAMDLEKILDYTYPKLFTIVPRDLMITTMEKTYNTDEFRIELDSLEIDTIFPIFRINDTSYAKVKHSMLMKMKYKARLDITDKDGIGSMVSLMEEQFGKGKVRFDPAANSLNIFMTPDMVAIKPKNEWTFINLNEDNPAMLNMLFSKVVLDKLKEFK